jgi:hypothetical protein
MKKILIATNIVLVGIILFQSCNNGSSGRASATSIPDTCLSRLCKNYDTVRLKGTINGEVLDSLSNLYYKDVFKSFISDLENEVVDENNTARTCITKPNWPNGRRRDAMSMFFDLEKIKNFIWQVERSVCKSGCDTSIKLGVRFYYIKYPNNIAGIDGLEGVPPDYKDKHALAMVPIYQNKTDSKWYDFYFKPNESIIGPCVFYRPLRDPGDGNFVTYALLGGDGDGTNHGGVGPPPEPGTYPSGN